MSDDNRISAVLTDETVRQIIAYYDAIDALLPFNISLTIDQRRTIPNISTERGAMDDAFMTQMSAHPDLVPSFVDMEEVSRDRELRKKLLQLIARDEHTREKFIDANHCAGSDNYQAYMAFYANVKLAAKRNVPGINAVLADLQRFFPSRSNTAKPAPDKPA
jgi:hypothetical protein